MSEVTLKVYKHHSQSAIYLMPNGKPLHFINHRYATSNPEEIAEMEKEVAAGNPFIYVDTNEKETVGTDETAEEQYKKKIIAEYEAARAQKKDFGNTDQQTGGVIKGIATSDTIIAGASGSDSAGGEGSDAVPKVDAPAPKVETPSNAAPAALAALAKLQSGTQGS